MNRKTPTKGKCQRQLTGFKHSSRGETANFTFTVLRRFTYDKYVLFSRKSQTMHTLVYLHERSTAFDLYLQVW